MTAPSSSAPTATNARMITTDLSPHKAAALRLSWHSALCCDSACAGWKVFRQVQVPAGLGSTTTAVP